MKKCACYIFLFIEICSLMFFSLGCSSHLAKSSGAVRIAVLLYRKDDTYLSNITSSMEYLRNKKEKSIAKEIKLDIFDGKNSQTLQNDQVDTCIEKHYDVICVNMVDRTAAAVIAEKAKAAQIPLVFFNREPTKEDLNLWNKAYYVGSDAICSGKMQGDIVADACSKKFSAIDKNGDHVIQYVMLEGEHSHQDALLRTEYAIRELRVRNIRVAKLDSAAADWQRRLAAEQMEKWIDTYKGRIELVLCNNDDMALGALDVYREKGIKPVPIVGVDGIEEAIRKVESGSMLGTVMNDTAEQAKMIFSLAFSLAVSGRPDTQLPITQERYIRVPYRAVTKENAAEILKQEK